MVALSLRSFSNSAPRPASAQNDSIIWAAMRFAAAISLVPVLRNITRRIPLMAGVVNRIYQLFLPGGAGCKKNFRVVHRTGTSSFRLFTGPMLTQCYILATELDTDFVSTKIHACLAFTWVKGICTVSSIGRASDS